MNPQPSQEDAVTIMTYSDLWAVVRTVVVVIALAISTLYVAGALLGVIG